MIDELRSWFHSQKRDFPWRNDVSPYRVWVSEVMLQQTRASVVIPYFLRWMETFPTIRDLASADEADVLKCWEGLGYYSRARNLQKGARRIVAEFGGELPATAENLSTIEGIGPYTVGAILSFAFHQKAAAVDGNVMRVLSRFWGIEAPIDLPATQREMRKRAQELLPEKDPWEISEALIELGALVCGKNPQCPICPLRKECVAKNQGLQLPNKRKKMETTHLYRTVGIVEYHGEFLVSQVEKGKVMEGLWEFPYVEREKCLQKHLGIKLFHIQDFPKQTHTFTRFKAHLFPTHWRAEKKATAHTWKNLEEIIKLPFSSGHRRILQQLIEVCENPP